LKPLTANYYQSRSVQRYYSNGGIRSPCSKRGVSPWLHGIHPEMD